MPKEVILGKTIDGADSPQHIRVGWGDHDLQVGVEPHGGKSIFWHLLDPVQLATKFLELRQYTDDSPILRRSLGADILNVLDGLTDQYNGLWVDMSREDCNRLIKTLRKARDAAFGRDE